MSDEVYGSTSFQNTWWPGTEETVQRAVALTPETLWDALASIQTSVMVLPLTSTWTPEEPEPMSYEEYVRVTREQEAADRRRFTGSEGG